MYDYRRFMWLLRYGWVHILDPCIIEAQSCSIMIKASLNVDGMPPVNFVLVEESGSVLELSHCMRIS